MEKDLVSDIRTRLSIEDVIGGYISLKASGQNYKALSPFKSEKTPSFVVTPSKDIWKDFSSGKGGDMFSFVMEFEGVDFKGALEILAEKAGLNMADYRRNSTESGRQYAQQKQQVLDVLEMATKFYQDKLAASLKAQKYLKSRGFTEETIQEFRMGYAPSSWQDLTEYFRKKKASSKAASLASLVVRRPIPEWLRQKTKSAETERWGDFFGDRLLIPLSDAFGKTIGFTGRILNTKDQGAKYINTKQSPVYNKSKHVFGYFQAKEAIRQAKYVIVVEGNLDVVACHQAGCKHTVAAGGTALTLDHLKIISRLTSDVRLAFDGDSAGIAAMERSIIVAAQAKVNLSVISLPIGSDPDDLIKANKSLWEKLIKNHQPALDWLYDKYKKQLDLKTALGKKQLTSIMLPIISSLTDEIEKDHYLSKLEAELKVSKSSLEKKLKQVSNDNIQKSIEDTSSVDSRQSSELPINPLAFSRKDRVNLLIGILLIEPKLRHLSDDKAQRLRVILKDFKKPAQTFEILQHIDTKITDANKLSSQLKIDQDNATICLNIVKKASPTGDFSDDFIINQQMFDEVYQQLDIAQTKIEKKFSQES